MDIRSQGRRGQTMLSPHQQPGMVLRSGGCFRESLKGGGSEVRGPKPTLGAWLVL